MRRPRASAAGYSRSGGQITPRLLYVDDEAALRRVVQSWLRKRGIDVHTARSIDGARRCFAQHDFQGVFIDLWLGDGSGFELYEWIVAHRPQLAERVAFITGDIIPNETTRQKLELLGRPVLPKPFDLAEIDRYADQWSAPLAPAPAKRDAGVPPAV
jgi:DNA-binding response OmpR family regulator